MIWHARKHPDPSPTQKRMLRTYGDNPDVTVLKSGNRLAFKCRCGCEFVVSQKFCETELTGEFSFRAQNARKDACMSRIVC